MLIFCILFCALINLNVCYVTVLCVPLQLAVGKHHCLVLTAEGSVYGWGGNSNQEITMGTAQTIIPTLIPELSRQGVKSLFCGTYFVSFFIYL